MTNQHSHYHLTAVSLLLFFTSSAILNSSTSQPPTQQQCECPAEQLLDLTAVQRRATYFCGGDLKRLAGGGKSTSASCADDRLYLCASSPREGSKRPTTAASIGRCPRTKRSLNGCNDSFKSRSDCLRNLKCTCRNLGRSPTGMTICGQQLVGVDCNAHVIYECRLVGAPLPLQSCPHGCADGRCILLATEIPILEVSMKEVDRPAAPGGESVQEDPITTTTTRAPKSRLNGNRTTVNRGSRNGSKVPGDDHEVEYVTFPPLIHIPLFNP